MGGNCATVGGYMAPQPAASAAAHPHPPPAVYVVLGSGLVSMNFTAARVAACCKEGLHPTGL